MNSNRIFTGFILLGGTSLAQAHTGVQTLYTLQEGLLHPFLGIDHFLVMLTIGVWASMQRGRALWVLPLSFMVFMALGASLERIGVHTDFAEIAVMLSLLLMGCVMWTKRQFTLPSALLLTSVIAISHGYVHASEFHDNNDFLPYASGFLISTWLLHLLGLILGVWATKHFLRLPRGLSILCTAVGFSLLANI